MVDDPAPPRAPGPLGPAAPPVSRLAIVTLVLGLMGFVTGGVTGLPGIVCGGIALKRIRGATDAAGMAIAITGLVLSVLSLLLTCLLVGLLLPALGQARLAARETIERGTVAQLAQGALTWTAGHGGKPPAADAWDRLMIEGGFVTPQLLEAPGVAPGRAYAMNIHLDGLVLEDLPDPDRTVLFFECVPGSAPAGGPELLPPEPRNRRYVISFVSGEGRLVRREELDTLLWEP